MFGSFIKCNKEIINWVAFLLSTSDLPSFLAILMAIHMTLIALWFSHIHGFHLTSASVSHFCSLAYVLVSLRTLKARTNSPPLSHSLSGFTPSLPLGLQTQVAQWVLSILQLFPSPLVIFSHSFPLPNLHHLVCHLSASVQLPATFVFFFHTYPGSTNREKPYNLISWLIPNRHGNESQTCIVLFS